jgi:hypothetical protein
MRAVAAPQRQPGGPQRRWHHPLCGVQQHRQVSQSVGKSVMAIVLCSSPRPRQIEPPDDKVGADFGLAFDQIIAPADTGHMQCDQQSTATSDCGLHAWSVLRVLPESTITQRCACVRCAATWCLYLFGACTGSLRESGSRRRRRQ